MTEFADTLHRQWGLSAAEVISSRRAEEAAASAVLGTEATFLPFRDAIYRGRRYLGDDQLFSEPSADEAGLPDSILEVLGLTSGGAGARIYTPLAVGFHVDHQHAFNAGVRAARAGIEVWFYEDLPYGLKRGGVDRRAAKLPAGVAPSVLVDVSAQWEAKLDAIFAYPSQLTTIFEDYVNVGSSRPEVSEAMANYAKGVGNGSLCERFWTLNGS
jgi:LmbE family N-acetylglucosaminyl deacetylase